MFSKMAVKIILIAAIVVGIGGLSVLLLMAVAFSTRFSLRQPSISETMTQVVATVGTRSITLAEVEQTVALSLYQLEEQRT